MLFCNFPCDKTSKSPKLSFIISVIFSLAAAETCCRNLCGISVNSLWSFFPYFWGLNYFQYMSLWKALNSIEREDEESNDHIQEIGSESSFEPLISELCETKYNEEPSQLQELVAVVDQVSLFSWISGSKVMCSSNVSISLQSDLKATLLFLPLNGRGISHWFKMLRWVLRTALILHVTFPLLSSK